MKDRNGKIAKCTKHPDRLAVGSINDDYLKTPTFYDVQFTARNVLTMVNKRTILITNG